jgi:hypothetical protein
LDIIRRGDIPPQAYLGNVQIKELTVSDEKENQDPKELSPEELKQVAGGVTRPVGEPAYKIVGVGGESADIKNKGEIG